MRRVALLATLGLAVAPLAIAIGAGACGIFPDVDGLTGGVADAAGDGELTRDALLDTAELDAGGERDGSACPLGRGPNMISVGAFCIDSTEVTMAQYAAFVADAGTTPSGQPAECAGNSVAPEPAGGGLYDPVGHPNLPVNSVDWCDAVAFCNWSGKRLCGAVGGGALAFSEYRDAGANQWGYACSHGGDRAYPYGNTYDGTRNCNGSDAGFKVTPLLVDVGSRSTCVGGFDGIFDMSGNVWEWVDSCFPCDGGRCCAIFGGSYGNSEPNLACAPQNPGALTARADERDLGVGFRCCSP